MKHRITGLILLLMLFISFSAHAINFTPEQEYASVAVVYTETGVGSGFSVRDNLIITNAHVVESNEYVSVKLYDGSSIMGRVIKSDADKDLALIEINSLIKPLEFAENGGSIGQEVYAVGAPRDMPFTMTKGIISALDRQIGQNSYIQLDASVNNGNSGGPLIDDDGKVLGIITLKASDAEGIGFAIKASEITAFTDGVEVSPGDLPTLSPDGASPGESEDMARLRQENEALKIAVIVLSVLLVISVLLMLKRRTPKKKMKDEFDFEIEIEE